MREICLKYLNADNMRGNVGKSESDTFQGP